jgi:hypothetical protein
MERFAVLHEYKVQGVGDACPTCGMTLTLPGLLFLEKNYCCHGCLPNVEFRSGEILPPTRLLPPGRQMQVTRAVLVSAEPKKVLAFLSQAELLHLYEQKLRRLQLTAISSDGHMACATTEATLGPMRFPLELHLQLLEGSYKSTFCESPLLAGLEGSFSVMPQESGSIVTHTEIYEFRGGNVWQSLSRLWRPSIERMVERELRVLKQLIEEPEYLAIAIRTQRPHLLSANSTAKVWEPITSRLWNETRRMS